MENKVTKKQKKKAMDILTENQAKWVELVLAGTDYKTAYVQAYNPETDDPKKLNTLVNKVRRKKHVQEALRLNQAEVSTLMVMWTKEKAITKLLKLLQKAEEDLDCKGLNKTNTDTILNAIRELNGIAGTYYKDKKKYEIDLANLEISRLRYELDKTKLEGPGEEEIEDDGFMEAIKAEVNDIWNQEEQ